MLKRIFILIFFCLTVINYAYPKTKERIAVLDFKRNNVSAEAATAVSDIIKSDIVNTGLFQVLERNQINEILKEQKFQQSECTDQTCAVEIGKILSASKILIGELTKVGDTIVITARLVNVENGIAEYASKGTAISEDDLIPQSSIFAKNLIRWITTENTINTENEINKKNNITTVQKNSVNLNISFIYFKPEKNPFKKYYNSLIGIQAECSFNLKKYINGVGGTYYVQGNSGSGNVIVALNSYHFGLNFGKYLTKNIYPYLLILGRITWFNERSSEEEDNFFGFGGDMGLGCAFNFSESLSFTTDYRYSFVKLNDSGSTDISGSTFTAGILINF